MTQIYRLCDGLTAILSPPDPARKDLAVKSSPANEGDAIAETSERVDAYSANWLSVDPLRVGRAGGAGPRRRSSFSRDNAAVPAVLE